MANRSYLYSTDMIPSAEAEADGRRLIGIAEWNYDVPIVFQLLMSGNPHACPSSIWENDEDIAIVADYNTGVRNLERFLAEIRRAEARPLIAEAMDFLNRPENQNLYFVLECGEIFDMEDRPILEQNLELLEDIRSIEEEASQRLLELNAVPTPGQDRDRSIEMLGLGNWSNILYYDFSED